jgi:predicted transposase YbfD/YdcC
VFDRWVEADFAGMAHDGHEHVDDAHGRHEERYTTVICDPAGIPPDWPDVAAVILVGREREANGHRADTAHSYITSLRGTAAELGKLIRRHWSVESELHWCLDVTFREDASRTRADHAGANLGLVRRVAVSPLKQDPGKESMPTRRLRAALDERYLEQALQGFKAK